MVSQESSDPQFEEMLKLLEPPMPVVDHDDESNVAAFYANRAVFITGATGFIGKAVIEKLVRSCPRVKRIYILMREKRGRSVHERMSDLIGSQFFDRIRQAHEGSSRVLEEKLCAIRGDITQPKFGITHEDMRLLSAECTIVINSAATVRFVEPIDNAVRNNIYSVGQLVEFCDELAHLEALIHLSTAYSNCHKRDPIDEIFYEPPMRGDEIQRAVEELSAIQSQIRATPELISGSSDGTTNNLEQGSQRPPDDSFTSSEAKKGASRGGANKRSATSPPDNLLEQFTRIALRRSNRPNTYTFTKAISENYLLEKTRARPNRYLNDKIPVAIVRPSIVTAAWREPIVGWIDNFNGPTGGLLAVYTGALQAMPGVGTQVCDIVPVDMVANMVLSAGWFLVERSAKRDSGTAARKPIAPEINQDQGVYLFNVVSGFRNPLRWHQGTDLIPELAYKYPSKYFMRLPSSIFIRAGILYDLFDLINHKLPAYMMDMVKSKFWCQRLESRSSSVVGYTRIKQAMDVVTPFTSNEWNFIDTNTHALYKSLDRIDKQVFHFDVASIDWYKYCRAYIIGSRTYLLRDMPKNVPAAMRQLQRRRAFYWISIGSLMMLIYFIFIRSLSLCKMSLPC